MKSDLTTEFLTRMQEDINRYGTKEYQLTTDRTISDLIVPKFLLFVLKDIDCKDVKDVLTNWIETGRPDKEAATRAAHTDASTARAARAAARRAATRAAHTDASTARVARRAAAYVNAVTHTIYAVVYAANTITNISNAANAANAAANNAAYAAWADAAHNTHTAWDNYTTIHTKVYDSYGDEILRLMNEAL